MNVENSKITGEEEESIQTVCALAMTCKALISYYNDLF